MLAWLAYLTASVVWGSTFLAIAFAIETFTPWGLSAVRFIPAGILALLIGRLRKESFPSWREIPHIALVGITLLGLCMALIGWAEGRVSSGLAATLGATVPLFLALMDPRGLDAKAWCGLGLGFLGVLVLLWPAEQSPALAGAAALVLSASLWAYGTLYGKRHAGDSGHFSQIGLEMLVAGALSLLAASLTGGISHGKWNPRSLLAVGYLITFGSILAYSAYIYLSKVWPSAKAGTYAYWNPVVGVLLGCWLRGETLHARMLPGLVCILLGVALVQIPWPKALRSGPANRGATYPTDEPGVGAGRGV
ncbi:MAG: EamA family transporter [Rhodoferax sp.]|uniref:EamA family transporter n=1 Tax=Rhodoferax sp. TaxID=50421 RepID=UPI0026346D1F|nr:EamA family transporter [Rhodoferax sp.]MDD5334565.1 EamA family transporter [Rhodoferax sp.]